MKIALQELPCRLVLKDLDGFLLHASMQGAVNLEMAKKIAVVKNVRVHRYVVMLSGGVLFDTGIPSHEPFNTLGLSELEIDQFFELDVSRDYL